MPADAPRPHRTGSAAGGASYRRRTVPLAGTHLAYHVAGTEHRGTPVVLLHPWFGCWQFWWQTIPYLPGRRCYAVDLYSPDRGDWSAAASPHGLADAVLAMTRTEGVDRFDLVGNSMGGIIAQVVASTVPDRVRRLVLVGTGATTRGVLPTFGQKVSDWITRAGAGDPASRGEVEAIIDMLVTRRPDERTWQLFVDEVWRAAPGYLAAVLAAARALDLTPDLPRITASTLVIRGAHDCARTPAHVTGLLAGIRHARAVEMPDAGHSPMVDDPRRFAALVADHLAGR